MATPMTTGGCFQSRALDQRELAPHSKYRPDVDGLRAVAVLIVVGFHAFPKWLPGGFVGVDIFFVISGFLISTIIIDGLEKENFRFIDFYSRRIRRIFPSLILVLVAVYVFGWFFLFPIEYNQIGKHMAGGAAFISNLLFWKESSYFANAADTKPLLHLWSLGVEEQFYLVWPLVLWIVWQRKADIFLVTVAFGSISLAVSISDTNNAFFTAAFYSPISRLWELLLGAAIAQNGTRTPWAMQRFVARWDVALSGATGANTLRNAAAVTGAALITASVIFIDKNSSFPGLLALGPTGGSALIILASPKAWLNRTLLAGRVMVWFGIISFPLYLWHWPLLSYARIVDCEIPDSLVRSALVALSVLAAWLTYKLVERPIRIGENQLTKSNVLIASTAMLIVIGTWTYWEKGLPFREVANRNGVSALFNFPFKTPSDEVAFWKHSCFLIEVPYTVYKKNGCETEMFAGHPKVFFIGDSFSGFLGLGLRPYLIEKKHYNVFQFSAADCTPMSSNDRDGRCRGIASHIFDEVKKEKPEIVIIFADYPVWQTVHLHYGESVPYDEILLEKTIELSKLGVKNIYIVGELPLWKDYLPKILARKFVLKGDKVPERTFVGVDPVSFEWEKRLRDQAYPENVMYMSLIDRLCDHTGCRTMVGANPDSDLITFDNGHLTKSGAEYITRNIIADYIN